MKMLEHPRCCQMIRWYTHHFIFRHHIADSPGLVDTACLTPHVHGTDEKPATLMVGVHGLEWIDFKKIKIAVLDHLAQYEHDGKMLDFGVADTEKIMRDIAEAMLVIFNRDITIRLIETPKYSIEERYIYGT